MPLPENNVAWPPPELTRTLQEVLLDDAWYSGDKQRLRDAYAIQRNGNGHDPQRDDRGRPWKFWERPRQVGRVDNRLHVPLPADIASTSADLLFSEPPTFTLDDTEVNGRLEEILEEGGVTNTLLEAAELGAALGGVYLRATWDEALAKRPILTAVHADGAVPEWRMGIMLAVTFWKELDRNGNRVMRHLERHEPGLILHGLYEGTSTSLGTRVPLTEHAETALLVDSLSADGDSIQTGITGLTAEYVPNMLPNRKCRGSRLGRSDWQSDGVKDAFMSLDETFTSWMRDLRLARARLIVPSGFLTSEGPGKGASFEDDREVWSEVNAPPTTGEGITMNQFAIRVAEHEQTWQALTRQAVQSAGYSAQSFGLGDTTAVTATEIVARERRSMVTRDKKSRYWRPALSRILEVALQLDVQLGFSRVTPGRPTIEFGDSVSEDPKSTAETLELLQRAVAASTQTKVEILHPDWDETAVKAETKRILAESGLDVADPTMTGAEGFPARPPTEPAVGAGDA